LTQSKRRGRPRIDTEARRNRIMKKAVVIFARHGFRNTDMQRIADAIGIAKGTIYLYFKTKDELFHAAVEYAIDRLAERIAADVDRVDDPIEKIKAVVRAHFDFFKNDKALAQILIRESGEFLSRAQTSYYRAFAANAVRLEKIIRQGIADELLKPVDVKLTAEILIYHLSGTIQSYIIRGGKAPDTIIPELITDIFLSGILRERNTA